MEFNESRVLKIICRELNVSEQNLSLDKRLVADLKADSLDVVSMLIAVEEELKIEISDAEAKKVKTVRDAIELARTRFTETALRGAQS